MLTDRGWAALGASLALVVLWIALGEIELLATGLFLTSAAVAAWLFTRMSEPSVRVIRHLRPTLVREGDQALVRTAVTNTGRWSIFNPTIEDEVLELGSARFAAARIKPGSTATGTYQILCRPRGIYQVGPTRITLSDPLRFAQRTIETGEADRLVVYPTIEPLDDFPVVRGRDPSMHAVRPEFSHRGGEDFFTLREYRTGDDLRRVHWPSSAKRDELMIRQLETPWQSRALVVLDAREECYESPADFEKAVRGAASVVRHLFASGFDTDLWTGTTQASSRDPDPFPRAMEALAAVKLQRGLDIRTVLGALRQTGDGGVLIFVGGRPDADFYTAQQMLARDYPATILLSVSSEPSASLIDFQRAGVVTISVPADGSWSTAWLEATRNTWSTVSAR
ncbi:MAG: DUF58 domain-containing protein [Acidimicrobiia bacterium]|nr:DUF58 domain-containing protein [Acidimicrobiia bacterium]